MSVKIGKARFGNGTQRKYFKLKDGDQVYRILPPLGDLADSGRWSVFHNVHYGYKNSEGKQRPFLSPEVKNRKTKTVEVQDVAKERIESLKEKLEEAKKSGNGPVSEKLNDLVGYPDGMYNLDSNHYMNVIDAQGNIGILKLRHKAMLALGAEIKKLNANGVDPLSVDDGRFFVFSRSGSNRDTLFTVSVFKEKLTVQGVGVVERDVTHKLDDSTLNRLGDEAGQLDKLFKKVTAEDVKKIVETSDLMTGVSKYMDELFAKNSPNEVDASNDNTTTENRAPTAVVEPQPVVLAAAAPATALKPAKAPPVVGKATQIAPVKATLSLDGMSSEDFLAALENGTL